MIDHDRLFKELLTTFFVEFLDLFLPEVRAFLDEGSIEFLNQEVFTDVTAGTKLVVDIIVKARFREGDACFLIHVEDQAESEVGFDKRMFRYFARLYEKYDLPVYPIALFTFDEPQRPEQNTHTVSFPDFTPLRFEFRAIQLNRLNWRDYVQNPNPVACALMAKMRIAPEDRVKVKVQCLRLLATLRLNPAKMQMISGFVDTYLRLDQREQGEFQIEVEALPAEEQEHTMQIMTSWMEEGMVKGEIRLVARRLHRIFGMDELETGRRLKDLSIIQLEALDEAVDHFTDAEDLNRWLKHTMISAGEAGNGN